MYGSGFSKNGQTALETVVIIMVVAAAFIAMAIYIKRATAGSIHGQLLRLSARPWDPSATGVETENIMTNIEYNILSDSGYEYKNIAGNVVLVKTSTQTISSNSTIESESEYSYEMSL